MIRLHVVVEGQTEETFVRDILAPHLGYHRVFADARCVKTGRKRGRVFRGGITTYAKIKHDLETWMKQDRNPNVHFTTMFDLYRLTGGFPGYDEAFQKTDIYDRIKFLEESVANDISASRGRFSPYIQVHEFEALLFSDPAKFRFAFPEREREIRALTEIRNKYQSPEHIDDRHPPSKQIIRLIPDYDKVHDGPMLIREIGLSVIRQECLHFDEWVCKLESLNSSL